MRRLARILILISICLCHSAQAKRWRNAYVSFELPPNWDCKLEGAEWVCENDYSKKQKEAIIILTAKEVGPSDSLNAYMTQLQTVRTLPGKNGAPIKSKIIHVQQRTIGNQLWVDGMHEGSEVESYFTRYMATIKDRIAILVTFSAHKEHFAKYANDFRQSIESLRVVATPDILGDHGGGANADAPHGTIGAPIGQNIPSFDGNGMSPDDDSSWARTKKKYTKLLLFALIIAGAGGYLYMQSKKPMKKKK